MPRPKRTTSSASTTSRPPHRSRSRTRWAARPAGPWGARPDPTAAGSRRRARLPRTTSTSPRRSGRTYTEAFSRALLAAAEDDPRIVALTAAMAGPTGLLAFQARFPDRFFDVGIAEQHEATSAAGMAMAGLRPVVAVYSTFWSRAFDQANLDVGLARLPGGLRARPGRHHRRRRAEPPRYPRPGAGAVHPRHDGVRAVLGRGGGADAAYRPRAAGTLHHPRPQDRAPSRGRRRGGQRAPGAPAARRRRVGVPARRGQDGRRLPERRRRAGRRRASTPPCGTPVWSRRPTAPCSRTRRAIAWW